MTEQLAMMEIHIKYINLLIEESGVPGAGFMKLTYLRLHLTAMATYVVGIKNLLS